MILGHASLTTTQIYVNSQELHQTGEKPQVNRSRDCRNSVPLALMLALWPRETRRRSRLTHDPLIRGLAFEGKSQKRSDEGTRSFVARLRSPGEGIQWVPIPDSARAVFNEDLARHYQAYLDRRRQARPSDEYRPVTRTEWQGFEEHFDQRKVELGGCARPYATACQHEHACLRCPLISINPKMLPRLDEIEDDLLTRRARAEAERWLGEIEGIDLTLSFLRQKRDETSRLARIAPVELGMPSTR